MKNKVFVFLDTMFCYTQLQYDLFLKNISPSNQPSIILGVIIGFPLALIARVLYIYLYCSPPPPWISISICFGCILSMLKIYEWNNRKEKVIKKKPMFYNSKKISLFIAILIQLISFTALFLGGPIGKSMLERCGW